VRAEPDEPTRLGVWLAQRMHKQGLSVRAVEELSGGRVSKSVISALTTGKHRGSRLSPDAIEGLADVFGVSPQAVTGMLDQRNPGTEYQPPWEARWLTKEQRAAVDAVIIAFFREG
jgi:transcriptional regulator with XRE-family HTH domain